MSFDGQPVPTTTHQQARAKVGDAKSVKVAVPANSGAIAAGSLQYFGGFLGFAVQSLDDDAENAQDLVLTIELAEYETDQVKAEDAMAAGAALYWDTAQGELTETPTPIYAGKVTAAKDDNDVVWFALAAQGAVAGRQAANQAASVAEDAAGAVADLNSLLAKLKSAGLMEADA